MTRIAKNTLFLYIRMFILLAVGLYTARVVLQALGETDYGIYTVVGGVVVLFSFLNHALTTATQRFLSFHIGKEDYEKVSGVFCMSINAYILLSVIILILAETVGLWFVDTQLNIPEERMDAALWVYHLSVATFIINLLRIPYNASIIAYERMHFFAYLSLIEAVLKLGVIYLLFITNYDRLVFYAALYTIIPLIINIIYREYCRRNFATTRYRTIWDAKIFRDLFSFSGWTLFGSIANIAAIQGLNILINIFFGVVLNAAVGIATNVTSHVTQFVSNFQTAFQPQIIKTYAAGKVDEFNNLLFRTSKFSFYLIFFIALPLLLTTQSFLNIWLTDVPPLAAIFCQLILIFMIIEAISAPLWMAIQATGEIRNYQIIMACCILLNLPLTYLAFITGMSAYSCWVIRIVVNVFTVVVRIWYLNRHLNFPVGRFCKNTLWPILKVAIIAVPVPLVLAMIIPSDLSRLIAVIVVSVVINVPAMYYVGMTKNERQLAVNLIRTKILRKSE